MANVSKIVLTTSGNKNVNPKEHALRYLRKAMPGIKHIFLTQDGELRKETSVISRPGGKTIEVISSY